MAITSAAWFSVDDGDQGESQGGVGSQDENDGVANLRGLLRRSLPVERAHQEAEVEPGDVDQIALVDVLASAQPGAPHAAAIEDMGEGPLDQLAAPAHRLAPDRGFQTRPGGVERSTGGIV